MDVSGGGRFSHTIRSDRLSKGLRHSSRDPRNSGFLVECIGAVGKNDVLHVIDELIRMPANVAESFPFPQLFVFTSIIIVCGQDKIYEWEDDVLVEKLTTTAGYMWKAVDFFEYVYLSNGVIAIVRNAADGSYVETDELPTAWTLCNFNGQVLVGSPDVVISNQGITITADPIDIEVSLTGEGL